MIYTLILSLIIVVIMSYIFMLEGKRKLCILEQQKDVTEKVYNRETTEYLFSKMNAYVVNNVRSLDKTLVKNFFMSNVGINNIGNDKYYISYNTSTDRFWVFQPYGNNKIKIDEYNYDIKNNKIEFVFDHTELE